MKNTYRAQRGFTLMELVVYMAIFGIIVLVAGQAFSNSTKMRVRTESMLKASEIAGNVGNLLLDDIAQMGAKSAMNAAGAAGIYDKFTLQQKVYISNDDQSSYVLKKNTRYDSLMFRKVKYSESGAYERTEEISWFAQGEVLKRSCKTLDGTASTDCPSSGAAVVDITTNVDSFKVRQALPVNDSGLVTIFPFYPTNPELRGFRMVSYSDGDDVVGVSTFPMTGAQTISVSGFLTNYTESGILTGNAKTHMVLAADSGLSSSTWNSCKEIEFEMDSTVYEISFFLSDFGRATRMFIPGKDHFAVGLRTKSTKPLKINGLDDFLIYTPAESKGAGKRRFRFSVPRPAGYTDLTMKACVAFSYAFFSPLVNGGVIDISNLRVDKVTEKDFTIPPDGVITTTAKRMVKAFEVELTIKKNGESAKNRVMIPVPSNGIKG